MQEMRPGRAITRHLAVLHRPEAAAAVTKAPPPTISPYVQQRIASWRLLQDLPFAALVPDPAMLPPESIRFFHLDPAWLDALIDGALSLGCDPEVWESRKVLAMPLVLTSAFSRLTLVRELARGRITARTVDVLDIPGPGVPDHDIPGPPEPPAAPPITGFLLRSTLVSGWPGTQVRGWTVQVPDGVDSDEYAADHPQQVVRILRIQRLSPAVLLVLFAGVPELVWIEEPHHGIQLGVNSRVVSGPGPGQDIPVDTGGVVGRATKGRVVSHRVYSIEVRDSSGATTGASVDVPMRSGPPGLVDVAQLASDLDDTLPLAAERGGAAMALALLQPPARQRFSATVAEEGR
jgi:hypothetical protein